MKPAGENKEIGARAVASGLRHDRHDGTAKPEKSKSSRSASPSGKATASRLTHSAFRSAIVLEVRAADDRQAIHATDEIKAAVQIDYCHAASGLMQPVYVLREE